MSDPYFVYIIAHSYPGGPQGPVKVGITKSLGSRLTTLQTGNWSRIEYAHFYQLSNKGLAFEIEQLFHEAFSESRMCGEWFGIEPSEALEILCDIVFNVINQHFPEHEKQRALVDSGAVASLKIISNNWGLPA